MNKKIPVCILGATGAVGQRFVQLLAGHPWFEIAALAASDRSAGRRYGDACRWIVPGDPPDSMMDMVVSPLEPTIYGKLAFSALPADVARQIEPQFAAAGYAVCSNASAFRYEPDIPLLIPEVNSDHLSLIENQRRGRRWPGFIVTNPNCSTTGISMALKPLHDAFGIARAFVSTMQAASGAGYPGVASLDILDNVLPFIAGEEEKIEREPRLLLGSIVDGRRIEAAIAVSAHANRVPVIDGHTICVSAAFEKTPSISQAVEVLRLFRGPAHVRALPSAPAQPVIVREKEDRPQPRRDRDEARGMAVSVGRIRSCPVLDLRFVLVVHNTIRGAAGSAILNGELLKSEGLIG